VLLEKCTFGALKLKVGGVRWSGGVGKSILLISIFPFRNWMVIQLSVTSSFALAVYFVFFVITRNLQFFVLK
jgi:hypothetical protein